LSDDGVGLILNLTKKELRRLNLRAKKGLGQHFLVNERVVQSMAFAAELSPSDTVVEVGPGLGVLTRELAKEAGRVIAVEIDPEMVAALKDIVAPLPNVTIVNADILKRTPESLVDNVLDYKVVGALPYNIASAVLRHFLEADTKPKLMVVAMQKEVAQTVAASPGEMGLLSVGVQFYGRPKIVDYVSARSFYPPPKVESAILRIDVYESPPVDVIDEHSFFNVVRGGFAAPRKQLHNSLAQGLRLEPADAAAILKQAGIDQQRRAETLSLEEWAAVYRAVTEK
jgi:16S rRNA (adenine1518-N6/adenine1519-N6)-dimethyltransferase